MIKMRFIPIAITLVVLTSSSLEAEEMERKESAEAGRVWVQPYHEFDTWQKWKLSSAYFVNPSAADRAKVGVYVPITSVPEEDLQRITGLVEQGKAEFSLFDVDADRFYRVQRESG